VVHEHHARTLHFDLRLEKEGVLKSWAVPKGVPLEPGVRRLAIQVDDHDLEYGDFEGAIPEGEYGAGKVIIWDRGELHIDEWTEDRITFTLRGGRLEGTWNMIRFPKGGDDSWLLFKSKERT